MKDTAAIQYVLDEQGNTTAVIVPIELWRELQSERETAYLLKSKAMKQRLIEAKNRQEGIPFEAVRAKGGSAE
jgi:PHD/YefM family antitoxin component YafN of YafNO toxin-antitoxin module